VPASLRPEDYRLLEPGPADGARYLVCYQGGHPNTGPDRWLLREGGATREQALAVARDRIGRGWAFALAPAAVVDAPWPAVEPDAARTYTLDYDRFVVLVPSPRPSWLSARRVAGPEGWDEVPAEPSLVVVVDGVEADRSAALERATRLGVRALVGRVTAIVDLEMGFEAGPLRKGAHLR